MAVAYDHITPPQKRIIHFAKQRLYEIETQMAGLKSELQMWNSLIEILNVCGACNGHGELRHQIAQDESETEICKLCNGQGFIP